MAILTVYHEAQPECPYKILTYAEDITATLAEAGIEFGQLASSPRLEKGADAVEVLTAFANEIERCKALRPDLGEVLVEGVDEDPADINIRRREHVQKVDEVRFFVAGVGMIALHIGELVYALRCERGDLLTLPAGTRRWYDKGERPSSIAVILCAARDQVLVDTGDAIASRFPGFDDFGG
ncbi:acireductone dioxygenase [Pseudomonas sp. Marseille-QA0892]